MPGRFSNLEFGEGEEQQDAVAADQQQQHATAPRCGREYVDKADEKCRWGRFEEALRLYTRALQEERQLVPAWVGQVQMLVQLGECHEARVWSDKALELFRQNGELLAAKAQACVRLGDLDGGRQCSDGALAAQGVSPWRWAVRGEVLMARRARFYEDCFQKAFAEAPRDWFVRVVAARMCAFYRRFTLALLYLKEAADLAPGNGYVWFVTGNVQAALGQNSAAAVSYERCLEVAPDYLDARRALDAPPTGGLFAWLRGFWFRSRRLT